MSVEEMTYEQAFQALQETVARLETGELALEDTLALYEHGQALARRCQDLLDQAELRVTELGGAEVESPSC